MLTVDTYPNINVLASIHYKRLSEVNVESSAFVNVVYLVLLVIYVLCKLYRRKKNFSLDWPKSAIRPRNMAPRLIRISSIRWWCSLFLF